MVPKRERAYWRFFVFVREEGDAGGCAEGEDADFLRRARRVRTWTQTTIDNPASTVAADPTYSRMSSTDIFIPPTGPA
jgi:hypothetical protein